MAWIVGLTLAASGVASGVASASDMVSWREALDVYWDAPDPAARRLAASGVLSATPPVDSLVAALRAGREYRADVPTGTITWTWHDQQGRPHYSRLVIPDDYDPSRRYAVYVYLHGSINRDPNGPDDTWWQQLERLSLPDRIVVAPSGWAEARWWQHVKVRHLSAILSRLRRNYNVDENRCVLGGVSDGGTGTWYQAMRAPTLWSGFLPFIGHPSVLNDRGEFADGQVYPASLANEALFVISGRNDPRYPTDSLEPYLQLVRAAGARVVHRPHEGGHNVQNWVQQWDAMEAFLRGHPRDPDPPHVVWRTEDVLRAPGAYCVQITELGSTPDDVEFPRFSVIEDSLDGQWRKVLALRRDLPGGQVEVTRRDNTWRLRTENVRWMRLLMEVGNIDLSRPVRVQRGGRTLLETSARIDAATLLKWSARLDDRTRLIGLEIEVDLVDNRARVVENH